jgi:hypothetical protein
MHFCFTFFYGVCFILSDFVCPETGVFTRATSHDDDDDDDDNDDDDDEKDDGDDVAAADNDATTETTTGSQHPLVELVRKKFVK